jgi:hypothetical protein
MMRKDMLLALPMINCYTCDNEPIKITDDNCKLIKDMKTKGKYKNSYELFNNQSL